MYDSHLHNLEMAPNISSFPAARANVVLRLMRHEGSADPFPEIIRLRKFRPGSLNPQGAPVDHWGRDEA